MAYSDVDRVARLIPLGPGVTLDKSLEDVPELKAIYQDPIIKRLIDSAGGWKALPAMPAHTPLAS